MRLDQLTFTRFLAAIAIVAYHFARETVLFTHESIDFIFKHAYLGVSYFFVLSGFVMVIAYQNRGEISFFHYLKNRIARIVPLYLFALIACMLIDKTLGYDKLDIIYTFTLFQSWIPGKGLVINFTAWSLSVEFFFYAMFPFLTNWIYKKWKLNRIAILVSVFWISSQILHILIIKNSVEFPYYIQRDLRYHPIMHFNSFLVGNLTGLIFLKYRDQIKRLGNIYLSLLLISLILFSFKIEIVKYFHNGMLAPLMAFLILTIALNKKSIANFFSKKVFLFLGEISFGIYILQKPVWSLLNNLDLEAFLEQLHIINVNTLFCIRLLILIVISMITYKLIEIPMQRLIKKDWGFNFLKP